ncbi:MAG: hypothetical protein ACRDPM_13370 [Solirubrobacteraceae bacterium]
MPGYTVIGLLTATGALAVAAVVAGRVAVLDDDTHPGTQPWTGYVEADDADAAKRKAAALAALTVPDSDLAPAATHPVMSIADTAWAIVATAMGQLLPDGAARAIAAHWVARAHGVELARLALGAPYDRTTALGEIARARVGADELGWVELDELELWIRERAEQ